MAITPDEAAVCLEDKYAKEISEAEKHCDEYLRTHYIKGQPCIVTITVSDEVLQGLEKVYDLWSIRRTPVYSQFNDNGITFTALKKKPTPQDVVTTHSYYNK